MKTIDRWKGIAFVAILGVCGLACTLTSGDSSGTGGSASGDGGSTSTGGSTDGGTGGATGSGGSTSCPAATPTAGYLGTTGGTASTMRPCDVYAADNGPCVAAHSTARALYGAYNGFLYQVRKADCTIKDIGVVSPGGLASSADQDTFCGVSGCTISLIYDQSGNGNHLTVAPPANKHPTSYNEANAKSAPITISGQKVYGVHIVPGIGYRNNAPTGTAHGDNAETEYMVVGAGYFNGGCCFDYGNMETTSRDDGEGTMEAVYFGKCTTWNEGGGAGPWVMGDLENGLWAGNFSPFTDNPSVPSTYAYITGMVKGDAAGKNHWAIKEGNAASGGLMTPFDGQRPSSLYNPMRKEGAIGLGTGGDGTSAAEGNWYEGVMTAAYSSNSADDAVQADIVSAYGQ
jgi:non-reducing end alpha-L-arabinofuranosidase